MNIKELNGRSMKKHFNCKTSAFRWHNKNNSGGNFGLEIRGLDGKNYEINGYYDSNGNIRNLRFGYVFHTYTRLSAMTFEGLINEIRLIILRTKEEEERRNEINSCEIA